MYNIVDTIIVLFIFMFMYINTNIMDFGLVKCRYNTINM